MQSWRSLLSIFTFLSALATLSHAIPTPRNVAVEARAPHGIDGYSGNHDGSFGHDSSFGKGGSGRGGHSSLDHHNGDEYGGYCDDVCHQAKQHSLYDIIVDIKVKITEIAQTVKTYETCDEGNVRPHFDEIRKHFETGIQTITTYISAELDITIILGGHSSDEIKAVLCDLLHIIVELIQFIAQTSIQTAVQIVFSQLKDLIVCIGGFIQVITVVVTELRVTIFDDLDFFFKICNTYGVDPSTFFHN